MKTIEEKAKAYDEAIKRDLDYIRHTPATEMVTRQDIFEAIFPEFAESEDYKIKKFIKEQLYKIRSTAVYNSNLDIKLVNAIDWLKKQDEKKPIEEYNDEDYGIDGLWHAQRILEKTLGEVDGYQSDDGILEHKCAISAVKKLYRQESNWSEEDEKIRNQIINFIEEYGNPIHCEWQKDWIAWLEKQGERKPQGKSAHEEAKEEKVDNVDKNISEFKAKDWYVSKVDGKIHNIYHSDKVETKFNIGDWVVRGDTIAQILDIQEQYYIGIDINGKDFTSSRFLNDDKIHLWSIADAKPGDVLVSQYNQPFIYNGNRDSFYIGSYCGVSVEDKFKVATEKCHWTENVDIYPATKEQRNTLFAKMKEEGYEWDADKKELKLLITNGGDF